MAAEDHRQEVLNLHRIIDGKDQMIAQLEYRHSEDVYLIKVLRNRLGVHDFDIAHVALQFSPICVETEAQTLSNDNHVAC